MLIFYALGLIGGIGFGWLQCRFLIWIISYQGKARPVFLMVKLLLWAACMIPLAIWSIPVLICYVIGATAAMLASLFIIRRRSKEE